jgi:peptide subunit release factor 1 (eRF1)
MPPITRLDVRELASRRGKEAVVSCYLDIDGRRFVRQQDLERQVDQLFRRVRPRVDGDAALRSDLSRIQAYVRRGVDRSRARGLAIFACGADQLFEVVPLPVSVPSQVVVASGPAVGPLESAIEDHERVAALLVDRQRARLLVVDWGEVVEHSELIDDLPRGLDGVGTRPRGDNRAVAVAASTSQHVRRAVQAAWELFQRAGFERLALAGPDEVVVDVERQLHPYLRERVVGRLAGVSVNASPEELRRAAVAHALEAERRKEAELVVRLREEAGSGRRAVAGLERTLAAVHHHRADLVMVSHGFSQPGWRCRGCGCLALRGRGCSCGTDMEEVDDVVAEVLDDALAQRARVEVCVANADLDVLGRIGAFLRF